MLPETLSGFKNSLSDVSAKFYSIFQSGGVTILTKHMQSSIQTYLINSNSPSGGIKLMLRSVSNLLSLTHCNESKIQ